MITNLIIKAIPFIKEVLGLLDKKDEKSTDAKLLDYSVIALVIFTIIALGFAEQAYNQALAKYKSISHVAKLENNLAECRSNLTMYHNLTNKGVSDERTEQP